MEYRSLITEFAASLGIDEMAFDDDGVARLAADDMVLAFMEIPERDELLIWSKVATPPPGELEKLYKMLLEASFMGRATHGACFSLEEGDIHLHRIDALVTLDVASLTTIVEDFLNLVETYRNIVEAYRPDDSDKPEEQPDGSGREFGSLGFMQV